MMTIGKGGSVGDGDEGRVRMIGEPHTPYSFSSIPRELEARERYGHDNLEGFLSWAFFNNLKRQDCIVMEHSGPSDCVWLYSPSASWVTTRSFTDWKSAC